MSNQIKLERIKLDLEDSLNECNNCDNIENINKVLEILNNIYIYDND